MGVREGFVQVNVQLSPAMLSLVDEYRSVLGVTRSNLLRAALYDYLKVKQRMDIDIDAEVSTRYGKPSKNEVSCNEQAQVQE